MEWVYWILYGAVGLFLFFFSFLIYWDLFAYMPTPFTPLWRGDVAQENGRVRAKKILLGLGVALTALCVTVRIDSGFMGFEWFDSIEKPIIPYILIFGFSAPITAIFLCRAMCSSLFGIFKFYEGSEKLYKHGKGWLRTSMTNQLRKRGRIE